jgi:hypothetical protein
MKNKNLQELFEKVMQEEKKEIKSLDEKSSALIKGGTGEGSSSPCIVDNCSKIRN